jgi:hypothetical protein
MESRIKQEYIREMKQPTREQLIAEVAVLTELVRVLSDRVAEMEKQEPVAWMYICDGDEAHPVLVHTQKDWTKASWWHEVPLYTMGRRNEPAME